MSKIFPEALVSGYEPLVDSMPNQSKDRHVAAAAVKIGAQVIVTSNLKDFRVLPEGIEAQSPDDFLCNLFDLDEEGMIGLLERQAADLVKPERTLDELLNGLRKTVPSFAEAVMERLNDETEGGWFRR